MTSPSSRGSKTSLNSTELTAAVRTVANEITNLRQPKERKKYHILPPTTPFSPIANGGECSPAVPSGGESVPSVSSSPGFCSIIGPLAVMGNVTPGNTPGNEPPISAIDVMLPFEALKGGIIIINESFTSDVNLNIVTPNDISKFTGFYEIDARNDTKFNVTLCSAGDIKFVIDGVDIIGSNTGSRWYIDLAAKEITRLN